MEENRPRWEYEKPWMSDIWVQALIYSKWGNTKDFQIEGYITITILQKVINGSSREYIWLFLPIFLLPFLFSKNHNMKIVTKEPYQIESFLNNSDLWQSNLIKFCFDCLLRKLSHSLFPVYQFLICLVASFSIIWYQDLWETSSVKTWKSAMNRVRDDRKVIMGDLRF